MILGSFLMFIVACVVFVLFPPAGFALWLISVVMFFVGVSARGHRKELRKMEQRLKDNERNPDLPPEQRFRSVPKSPPG